MFIEPPRRDPSTPLMTYYNGSTGERTELSTTSMLNWQAKTANLLRDSYGLSSGSTIGLFIPTHWLVPVFIGAVAAIGGTLVIPGSSTTRTSPTDDLDLAVIGQAELTEGLPSADEYLACSLLPMAVGFDHDLPAGVEDYAIDVRAHGDFFPDLDDPTRCPQLRGGGWAIDSAAVVSMSSQLATDLSISRGDRLLIPGGEVTTSVVLAMSTITGFTSSTTVIVDQEKPQRISAIAEQEKVTNILPREALNG